MTNFFYLLSITLFTRPTFFCNILALYTYFKTLIRYLLLVFIHIPKFLTTIFYQFSISIIRVLSYSQFLKYQSGGTRMRVYVRTYNYIISFSGGNVKVQNICRYYTGTPVVWYVFTFHAAKTHTEWKGFLAFGGHKRQQKMRIIRIIAGLTFPLWNSTLNVAFLLVHAGRQAGIRTRIQHKELICILNS